jgi:hypothetical protein
VHTPTAVQGKYNRNSTVFPGLKPSVACLSDLSNKDVDYSPTMKHEPPGDNGHGPAAAPKADGLETRAD